MHINIITVGQSVRQVGGKYNGEKGYVTRMYFLADNNNVGYYARVRFRHAIGTKRMPINLLIVTKS